MTRTPRVTATIALTNVLVAGAVLTSAIAHADPDTDFSNALHAVGIYGPKDYNAWIGKIACQRLDRGVDHDAHESARFVSMQLSKTSTTEQSWQFVALAYPTYCPEKQNLLQQVAAQQQR